MVKPFGAGSSGYLGDELLWSNPDDLGHVGIRVRKQLLEDKIIARMLLRAHMKNLTAMWTSLGDGYEDE